MNTWKGYGFLEPLRVLVCPHDTANDPDRWYQFVQYLAQHLEMHFDFPIMLDFSDFEENLSGADIVYANPSHTLKLLQEGFAVLVRPANLYDEVVFVASNDIPEPTLFSLHGATIVSVPNLLPTKLALHILKTKGIEPAGITSCFSWMGVMGAIWRGDASYGFVYKDTYNELTEQGKNMVQLFSVSEEQVAFHSILVGRKALSHKEVIQQILLNMDQDDRGIEILHELHIPQWEPITSDALDSVRKILETY